MTKQQAIQEHRKMWNWIADETERTGVPVSKLDYLNTHVSSTQVMGGIRNGCFCCEYFEEVSMVSPPIEKSCRRLCPIAFTPDKYGGVCENSGSPYTDWKDKSVIYSRYADGGGLTDEETSKLVKEIADLARKIANLPERNGGEYYE